MNKTKNLTINDILHLANLSALKLNEEELNKFKDQLGQTLTYVDILNKIDLGKVKSTDHVNRNINIFRPDIVLPSLKQEEALKNAQNTYQGFFKVSAVMENK